MRSYFNFCTKIKFLVALAKDFLACLACSASGLTNRRAAKA
jgi:hypothetical protein